METLSQRQEGPSTNAVSPNVVEDFELFPRFVPNRYFSEGKIFVEARLLCSPLCLDTLNFEPSERCTVTNKLNRYEVSLLLCLSEQLQLSKIK